MKNEVRGNIFRSPNIVYMIIITPTIKLTGAAE